MQLWTDIIDPATLTGYLREAWAELQLANGNLARFLPNRFVSDIQVRMAMGQTGMVEEAQFRAYDAEPEVGKHEPIKRFVVELPALTKVVPFSEYNQLRARNASDEQILDAVRGIAVKIARDIDARVERQRGIALRTGKSTIPELAADDDFGRDVAHTVTAGTLWSSSAVSRLADLQAWADLYETKNGVAPGVIVASRRVLRALAAGDEFKLSLVGGGSRPATVGDVNAIIEGAGLPPIETYTRRTDAGPILPEDELLMLPEPVDPTDWESAQLGATFWGRTLSSQDADWQIPEDVQPGIVAGVYQSPKPPMVTEAVGDAIALPVLANANLSLKAKVL